VRTRSGDGLARPRALLVGAVTGCLVALGIVPDGTTVAHAPPSHTTGDRAPLRSIGPRAATEDTGVRRPPGRPRVVAIPAIGVRAHVVPISAHGRVLVPPSDPARVGWWRDGARPGEAHGAALLTGHTVSTGGGAFDHLDRLRPGQTIRLTTSHGRLSYTVDTVRALPTGSLAPHAQRLFGRSGRARLVLVTCEAWNGEAYLASLVVTARADDPSP
jgi:LPXTG-site transpeptidase (sortase) family protein